MKKYLSLVLAVLMALAVIAGCAPTEAAAATSAPAAATAEPAPTAAPTAEPEAPAPSEPVDIVTNVTSVRNTDIPTGILIPAVAAGEKCPIVVLLHGLWDNMDDLGYYYGGVQNGANSGIAEKLYDLGIATVRLDFPGCGTSTDSLENYTNDNMVADAGSALKYVLANYECVDGTNVGVVGFSYGGRIAPLFAEKHPEVTTMVLNSPAAANGGAMWEQIITICGQDYNRLYTEAKETGKSRVDFGDPAIEKYISWDFFVQNEECKSCDALAAFQGNCLMLCGTADVVIPASSFQEIIDNTSVDYLYVKDADHDFGFTSDNVRLTHVNMEIVTSYLFKHMIGA